MHKHHKYKSKCYNELSVTPMISPKGISLLWPIPLPHSVPASLLCSGFCGFLVFFFANYVILTSVRVTPPQLCTLRWLIEGAKCQIRNSKLGGGSHSTYWVFPLVAWLGKGGKEEGKGETMTAAREQLSGVVTGHESVTITPLSTWTLIITNPTPQSGLRLFKENIYRESKMIP